MFAICKYPPPSMTEWAIHRFGAMPLSGHVLEMGSLSLIFFFQLLTVSLTTLAFADQLGWQTDSIIGMYAWAPSPHG